MNEASIGSESPEVPQAAVSVAVFRGRNVLLVQRGQPPAEGLWSLPGGHIEPGETALRAAERELREETGICADFHGVADAVDVIHRNADGRVKFHRVVLVFCGTWVGGDPVAGSDARAAGWHGVETVCSLSATAGLKNAVAKAWAMVNSEGLPSKS